MVSPIFAAVIFAFFLLTSSADADLDLVSRTVTIALTVNMIFSFVNASVTNRLSVPDLPNQFLDSVGEIHFALGCCHFYLIFAYMWV